MSNNHAPYDPNILPPEFDGITPPQNEAEVGSGFSPVASGAKRGVFLMVIMFGVAATAGYFFYKSTEKPAQPAQTNTQVDTSQSEALPEDKNLQTVTQEDTKEEETATQVVPPPSSPELAEPENTVDLSPPKPAQNDSNFLNNIALPDPFIPPPEAPEKPEPETAKPTAEEEVDDGPPMPPAPPGLEEGAGAETTSGGKKRLSEEQRKSLEARRRSNMIKMNASQAPGGTTAGFAGVDPTNAAVELSAAEKSSASYIGKNSFIIAQGKIIDAVLETAINTDIPGTLRAIVSRDIYAESGKNILIPRGSRLVGSYDAEIKRGQKRVYVIWQRVLRPDGIDVEIKSPGTDSLGRAGIAATSIDNRYFEIFGNSLLLSTLTIGGAIALDKVTESQGITSSTSSGGATGGTTTSTTGRTTDLAVSGAVKDIGEVTKTIAQSFANIKPTITVDQGTRIKVFVNRDLIFPSSVATGVNVLP